jgi:hypothetical protein
MLTSKYFILILISIHTFGISGSWLTSCKSCLQVLNICNYCQTFEECNKCFGDICPQCLSDIFNYGQSTFYCDSLISYHVAVCGYYCKPNTVGNAYCDYLTGKCTCSTDSSNVNTTLATTIGEITTTVEIIPDTTSEIVIDPITETPIEPTHETTTEIVIDPITEDLTVSISDTTTSISITETNTPWNSNLYQTSCLPCTDILEECSTCLKDSCYTWYFKFNIYNKKGRMSSSRLILNLKFEF